MEINVDNPIPTSANLEGTVITQGDQDNSTSVKNNVANDTGLNHKLMIAASKNPSNNNDHLMQGIKSDLISHVGSSSTDSEEETSDEITKKGIHIKNPYASSSNKSTPKKPHDWVRSKVPPLPTKQAGRKKGPAARKPIDPMMAKKQELHAKKRSERIQSPDSNDEEDKYNYLKKKDWDEMVMEKEMQ